jgi:UDP-N-acetylmuramate dehydrogenase
LSTELLKNLGENKVITKKDISPYLTFRTKTLAEYFYEANTKEDLINSYKLCKKINVPFFLLGGGSNLAVTKDIIPGLVVKNSYQKKEIISENNIEVELLISSGYPMGRLVMETVAKGWEGFEYHLGLPGTIGGGIYMNSKWTKPVSNIGDNVLYAYVMDAKGETKKVDRDYFKFAYDYSILQVTGEIVLEIIFKLKKNTPEILKKRAQQSLAYRKQTQPYGSATVGCFFQNVDGKSAGQMIDLAGLKNKQIGSYIVSDKHANFIINKGEGNPADLLELLTLIKHSVKLKFGVELKEEVIVI